MTRDEQEPRQAAALAALREFRSREGNAEVACLLGRAESLDRQLPHERRREELIERAIAEQRLPRAFAEQVFEIARDEGLEPAFAFELVRCGVGVQDLEEQVYHDSGQPSEDGMTMQTPPEELVAGAPTEPVAAVRELRLRSSFRRLRRHLESSLSAEDALLAFTAEADVGRLQY
jgi:hypothetical protein